MAKLFEKIPNPKGPISDDDSGLLPSDHIGYAALEPCRRYKSTVQESAHCIFLETSETGAIDSINRAKIHKQSSLYRP